MQVILKRPGEVAKVGYLADYNAIHDYIGGCFETVPLECSDGSQYLIVCNDNFLNDGSHFNIWLGGFQFFGNIFICKIGVVNDLGECDFVGLDPADILNIADNLCLSESDMLSLIVSGQELDALPFK